MWENRIVSDDATNRCISILRQILSPDDSEFFANGMHDDLLTQLAQLQSLRVISRTSVLGYRDSNRNIREIGRISDRAGLFHVLHPAGLPARQ